MKILSWDIGIKNLSYCLIEDNKIIDWGIISLEDEIIICNGKYKNGNCCKCKALYVKDNEGYCKRHNDKNFKLLKKKKYSLLELGERLTNELNKFKDIELDNVLLENQPCLKNPTMKSIQMIIFSYFLINGFPEKIKHIQMYAASNKNKYCNKYCKENNITKPNTKSSYQNAKKTAIMVCDLLVKDTTWYELFSNSKKKDDLADSYLQGITYLHNKSTKN